MTRGPRAAGRWPLELGAASRGPDGPAATLQMGTNKCASQSGMTAYGTRRHLYDPKNHILPPMDHSTISLQMGTNKCASQVGPPDPRPRPCRRTPRSLAVPSLSPPGLAPCVPGEVTPRLCASVSLKGSQGEGRMSQSQERGGV